LPHHACFVVVFFLQVVGGRCVLLHQAYGMHAVLVSRPLSGCDAARQSTAPCPSQTWSCCMWHYDGKSRLVKLGLRSPCYQSGHGSAASDANGGHAKAVLLNRV
jgi:hypothetical protein